MQSEYFDQLWKLKETESNFESYIIQSHPSNVSEETIAKNDISRARQQRVMAQDKFVVRKWEAFVRAPGLFLNTSRYVKFIKGVIKTIIAVLFLYCTDDNADLVHTLSKVSAVILLPFALASGLNMLAVVGRNILWITDEELYAELGWLYRLFAWCCDCCCSNRVVHSSSSKPENEKDKEKIEMKSMEQLKIGIHDMESVGGEWEDVFHNHDEIHVMKTNPLHTSPTSNV